MKIVILDALTFGEEVDLSILSRGFDNVEAYGNTPASEVSRRIQGAGVVVTNKICLTEKILSESPVLRLVAVAATGTNNVDIAAARRLGIAVANVPSYAAVSVAAHTFALYFSLAHHMFYHNQFCQGGSWSRSDLFTHLDQPWSEPAGKTWGIVGMGATGQIIARQAEALGFRVLYHSTSGKNLDHPWPHLGLDELLSLADVVSLHATLTEQTEHLIDTHELAMMRSHALLINTSRGKLINEAALVRALEGGVIAGAGLDVLQEEPPLATNPLFSLSRPERLVMTPHIAGLSTQGRIRLISEVRANIDAFLEGVPRNLCGM